MVYEILMKSEENLIDRLSVAARNVRNMFDMFANVRQSIYHRCESCISLGGSYFVNSKFTVQRITNFTYCKMFPFVDVTYLFPLRISFTVNPDKSTYINQSSKYLQQTR